MQALPKLLAAASLALGAVAGPALVGPALVSPALADPALAQEVGTHHKIGIIGSGHVGSTLGVLWAKAGDDVMFASRHPDDLKEVAAKAGPHASVGTPAEAAAFGDVVVIAVPYKVLPDVAAANAAALKGKVVFDASNAVPPRDGALVDEVRKIGIGAYSTKLMPDAHLVRGFNAINYKNMEGDSFRKDNPVGIPLAGDDPKALAVGAELVKQAGFVPVVVPLARADEIGPQRPLGTGVFTVAEWKQKLGLPK